VVGSAEELKTVSAKLVRIPKEFEVIPETRQVIPATYDKFGDVITFEWEVMMVACCI